MPAIGQSMVRKVTVQGFLDFAEPEAIFDTLFRGDEFMKRFHKKINCDPHAEASSWNEKHEREVKYVALTEAPKMITKLIGESFPVREAQVYMKDGDFYTITCTPRIDTPSGDRFVTIAETVLSPNGSGGCAITSYITLECKGGFWGLEGAVENYMETKAKTGAEQWLKIAKSFCLEKLARASGPTEIEDAHERFFDAQEVSGERNPSMVGTEMPNSSADMQRPDISTPVNGILNRFRAAFSASPYTSPSVLDSFFMQTVLRDVNDIQISCNALQGHVQKLNTKMLQLEGDLASVRVALERQRIVITKRKQLTLLGAGFAVGFGLGVVYYRMKRQT